MDSMGRVWVGTALREVACEMRAVARKELLLEECRVDNKQRARWLPCLPRATKTTRTVPTTIDVVAEKLEELKNQYERFGYTTGLPLATCTGTPPSPCVGGQEEITTIVTADVLVRGDDKQRIIDITTADQIVNTDDDYSPATILPIFGPPCVGKTALVRSVFGDERFRDYLKVMISMPKGWEFIVQEIFRETAIPVRSGGLCSTKYVTNLVRDELDMRNKRLLLVLDDLMGCSKEQEQDDDVLEHLRRFLYDVDSRVIAIVVTPSEAIAEYMSKTLKPYRLHPMADGLCWEIIKGTACGLQQTRTTAGDQGEAAVSSEMMGPEIASKCSGLPLAAKALGRYYLQSSSVKLKPAEWPGEGENPDIWNIIGRGGGGGFPPAASQLPLHSLVVFTRLRQSCSSRLGAESWLSFAFCAFVLPKGKGHSLVARDLLNHWCSLGITTRQRGTSCVSELLDRSLLLRDKPSLTVAATLLTWESLMHDFASYHFGNVWVVVDRIQNGATPQSPSANKSISSSWAYMALTLAATLLRMEDLMHDFASYLLGDRLIVGDGGRRNGATAPPSSSVNKSSCSAYLALVRNLDAKSLDISSTLPAGILALRFEDCGQTELSDGEFASAKYACLRLLDLSGCSAKTKKLPYSIRHLKQLRYLKAPGIQDQVFPKPIITGLHKLRYLNLQGSCQLADLTDAFQRLSNLLHLYLSGCSGLKALPASFGRLWRLELLDLSACSGLESLPEDSFGWLRSLRHLDLAGCSGLKALPGSFEKLAGVLRYLDLSRCSGLELLPSSLGRFSELRHLDLSELSGITRFPDRWPDKLVHLDLSGCSGLTDMAPIYRIDRLRYLDLSGCSRLQAPSERFVEDIRRKGRASGPKDASLK